MTIATITPTRGDRAPLFEFCQEQIDNQTVQPDKKYFIGFNPDNGQPDLTKRIRFGVEKAKADGIDWIFVLEDDDSYPNNYLERFIPHLDKYDFIGDPASIYYNIQTRRWTEFKHPRRASLFTTAFRVSALDKFKWPPDNKLFLDIDLWKYAKNKKCKFINTGAVGIKGHNFGKHGGKGHTMHLNNEDPVLHFLKSKVTPRHFDFYTTLMQSFFCVVLIAMLNISALLM